MNLELHKSLAAATEYCQISTEFAERILDKEMEITAARTAFEEERASKRSAALVFHNISKIAGIIMACLIVQTLVLSLIDPVDFEIYVIFFIFLAICAVVFIITKKSLIKHAQESEKIEKETLLPQIATATAERARLSALGKQFMDENKHVLAFLPNQYQNLQACSYMLLAVKNGRADSLKEVINLYEEQLHRWKLEHAAQQQAEAQEYMALAMQELNDRQAETNQHLRAIEFMQYWEYLNK